MTNSKIMYFFFLLYLLSSIWIVECLICHSSCGSNLCSAPNDPSQCDQCSTTTSLTYAAFSSPNPCVFDTSDPFTSTIELLIDISPTSVVGTGILKNYTKNGIVRNTSG